MAARRLGIVLIIACFSQYVRADIHQWEYIDPLNPSLGKQQSATLTPGGAGVNAVPNAALSNRNLTQAYLIGADLTDAAFYQSNLTNADLGGAVLVRVNFWDALMTNATFAGADIRYAQFWNGTKNGFTAAQLYSTASYQLGDLSGIHLSYNDLTDWNLASQDLTAAEFYTTTLVGTDFTNAKVARVDLSYTVQRGFTASQLYSTASYQDRDLTGITLRSNDLSGWDFSNLDLTDASLFACFLTDTDFTGATIRGANFGITMNRGFTKEQLYSTVSYQRRDLRGLTIWGDDMKGWNFADQDLQDGNLGAYFDDASFRNAYLANVGFGWSGNYPFTNTDFTGADLRGSRIEVDAAQTIAINMIDDEGIIAGLDLTTEPYFLVRDYDGYQDQNETRPPLPIQVMQTVAMNPASALELRFDADEWNSTISFEAGIPIALDGTLELTFADDVNIMSQVGRTLDLFDWTGVTPTGLFTVASDYTWDLSDLYTTGEVTLTGITILPGDIDGDGDVDGRDFLAVQRDPSLGSLAAWQANYGDSVGGMANFVRVPEPGGVMVMVLAVLGMAKWPRVHTRRRLAITRG